MVNKTNHTIRWIVIYPVDSVIQPFEQPNPEVFGIPKKFVLRDGLQQPGHVYVKSFGSTQNWQQGKKTATDLAFFARSAKAIFSKQFSTSLASMLSFRSSLEHVWFKIIQLKSSHNPER